MAWWEIRQAFDIEIENEWNYKFAGYGAWLLLCLVDCP